MNDLGSFGRRRVGEAMMRRRFHLHNDGDFRREGNPRMVMPDPGARLRVFDPGPMPQGYDLGSIFRRRRERGVV